MKPIVVILAFVALAAPAAAQNLSGMSGPEIKAGERAFDYRIGYAPADDGGRGSIAHRFHYQQSLSGALRLRGVIGARDRAGEAFDVTSLSAQAFYQFIESEDHGFDSALVGQLSSDLDGGGKFTLAWSNSVKIGERGELTGTAITGRELGDGARDGLVLELRGEAMYEIGPELKVGAQMFSDFNTTDRIGSFDEQEHQLGFVFRGKVTEKLSYNAGALFGLSDAASDVDLRLFLAYSL